MQNNVDVDMQIDTQTDMQTEITPIYNIKKNKKKKNTSVLKSLVRDFVEVVIFGGTLD